MRVCITVATLGLLIAGCSDTKITADRTNSSVRKDASSTIAAPATTQATVRPTTTTTPARTEGSLGDTFTVSPGDRKITAFTFKLPVPPAGQFSSKPRDGYVYAAAEVQECAGPAGEKFSPNRFDFELAMADNTRIQAGVEVQSPQLASSPLLPGDCIRGWVSFEVPSSGTVRQIVYSVGNASAKWRVS